MSKQSYWQHVFLAVRSISKGLRITSSHLGRSFLKKTVHNIQQPDYFSHQNGIATVQFPHEQIPVPDNGRYKLHNEMDDCIVCDKCAKICPVNCITIEPIKSPTEFGRTSDDTPKRIYAAKFDIDMGKCCFCGLCTTVCPTECLTMTKEYDFSVFNIQEHNFPFANLSAEEITAKKTEWETFQKTKEQATTTVTPESKPISATPASKPVFKPRIKPPTSDSAS